MNWKSMVIFERIWDMEQKLFEKIGDHMAEKEGYVGLKGMQAVHRYLIDKYGWKPDQVRQLSTDDLHILLAGYEEKPTTAWN
ncbi:MAG: hypothetical protein ACLQBD_05470 [Syntrophobacteraceae bacterium]